MKAIKKLSTFPSLSPAATRLALNPEENNILAAGMEDSSIEIYDIRFDEVIHKLQAHEKRVTGLAFSNLLKVLVSSGADAQLCVWGLDEWVKKDSSFLQIPTGRVANPLAPTRVQFHKNQIDFLTVHDTHIAFYAVPNLECLKKWVPRESTGSVKDATLSCCSQLVYAIFEDGSLAVLTTLSLELRCWIIPSAYLFPSPSLRAQPLVIAAHPLQPNHIAVGLSDGGVHILEPGGSVEHLVPDPSLEK